MPNKNPDFFEYSKDESLIVRIEQLQIQDLKNVRRGSLTINSKKTKDTDSISSILGLYGPNSSGKTAALSAIKIIKTLLSGLPLTRNDSNLIYYGSSSVKVSIKFSIRNQNFDKLTEVNYSARFGFNTNFETDLKPESTPKVLEEELEIATNNQSTTISDTLVEYPIKINTAKRKRVIIIKQGEEEADRLKKELWKIQLNSINSYHSGIFEGNVLFYINKHEEKRFETRILNLLKYYAINDLNIVTTSMFASIPLNGAVNITAGILPSSQLDNIRTFYYAGVGTEQHRIEILNTLLEAIFPGTRLKLEILGKTIITVPEGASALHIALHNSIKDATGYVTQIKAVHTNEDGKEICLPLSVESEGFRRIVAILGLYVKAYYNPSATLVIDEIDNGIFEYVLSTIIELFDRYGKGQLIFTCHNLGPIERITKTIYFTTPDPNNRYSQIKNIHATNNLRKMYLGSLERGDMHFWSSSKDRISESLNSLHRQEEPSNTKQLHASATIIDVNYIIPQTDTQMIDPNQLFPHLFIQARVEGSRDYITFDLIDEMQTLDQQISPQISFEHIPLLRGKRIEVQYDSELNHYIVTQPQIEALFNQVKCN